MDIDTDSGHPGAHPSTARLGIQGNIADHIHSFDEARRSDMRNERLPEHYPTAATVFPTPSMQPQTRRSTMGEGLNMEYLIKKTLEEDSDDGIVERLAEKIARGRVATGRPSALKRHETV